MKTQTIPDLNLSPNDVARKFKIDPQTARRLMRSRELPAKKVGGKWRTCQQWIDDYIKSDDNRAAPSPTQNGSR